jgi:hypothetical protein
VDKILLTKGTATPTGQGGAALACSETPVPPPSAPTLLTATGGVSQASLTWTNSDTETSYKLERKPQGALDSAYVQAGTAGANVVMITDPAVVAGTYTYRVKASNSGGDTVSTNTLDATVSVPAAPTGLTAMGGTGQATLNWTDNAGDMTGFRIERRPSGGSFAQVIAVAAGVRMFTDSPLAAGTYDYQVKAINGPNDSLPSNIATAMVTAPAGPSITNLVVNDTATTNPPAGSDGIANSTQWSVQANFAQNATVFGDRTYTVSAIGNAALAGKPWIRTAADSKNYTPTTPPLATFTVTGTFVNLYVDDRHATTFLTGNGFTDTGVNATVMENSTPRTYSIWRKAYTSGSTVTLPTIGSTTAPCYFVVVE